MSETNGTTPDPGRLLQAVLLLEGEPTPVAKLAQAMGMEAEATREALTQLQQQLVAQTAPLQLIEVAGGYCLAPAQDLWPALSSYYRRKDDRRLSRAAMETLSIIAYTQPATRGQIEGIRGVSADAMIRQLQARGMVTEVGRKEGPGRPIQYGTTQQFLAALRLRSIADLPRLEKHEDAKFG